ncbi:MAG: hypothetical protein JWO42_1137, partial [Chloroflexi bacterium]|nr:hypothetical protein [Chloroflexota bacterium]
NPDGFGAALLNTPRRTLTGAEYVELAQPGRHVLRAWPLLQR